MEQLGSEILFFNDLKEDNNALMLGRDKHLHYWCLIMVIESVHNTLSLRFSILHVPVCPFIPLACIAHGWPSRHILNIRAHGSSHQ